MNRYIYCLVLILFPLLSFAENLTIGLDSGNLTSKIIQMIGLVTILSLAPSILIMVTSFTRIIIVFSFLRSAIGLQQSPPNSVLVSLALFLTGFIMMPSFEQSYKEGILPLIEEKINEQEAFPKIIKPFREFMIKHVREKDLNLFLSISGINDIKTEDISISIIIPAFMISELKRAFEIGFLIFIPFLIIDVLISSILMAMGMMMLPPVMISLPFKLIFFVVIDGWYMICGSLVKSYNII
ncbi:MAG: flagellar biosynthesis protein FliP [Rickettsiales bacterium]|nr:MAG: flagellar biosynthesis protein FliP [Rickettsiales bacterium]